jgi:hypothetical protein
MFLLVMALVARADTSSPTMVEHAIASGANPIYLDGAGWTATNNESGVTPLTNCTVPGDIITDLEQAGRVGDPYWNTTWRDPAFVSSWHNGSWTYTRTFATPSPTTLSSSSSSSSTTPTMGEVLLVLDGIRMGARVMLNGALLGEVSDQFLRYVEDDGDCKRCSRS